MLTTDFEGSISLTFKNDTFEITDAKWGIHRAPDMDRRGEGTADMLIGHFERIQETEEII